MKAKNLTHIAASDSPDEDGRLFAICGADAHLVHYASRPVCPACMNGFMLEHGNLVRKWNELQSILKTWRPMVDAIDDTTGIFVYPTRATSQEVLWFPVDLNGTWPANKLRGGEVSES